jgi:GNAT superfamily N-acetyltransferase
MVAEFASRMQMEAVVPNPVPRAVPDDGQPVVIDPAVFRAPAGVRSVIQTVRGPIVVRPVTPLDAAGVDALIRTLSPASSIRRFHAPVSALTPRQLAGIVDVDHRTRETLVALDGDRVVGLVQYLEVPPGAATAEVAVVVADQWHRVGLGRHLLEEVLAAAARSGHTMATALVQADNRPVLELVRTAGLPVAVHRDGTVLELLIDLAGAAA